MEDIYSLPPSEQAERFRALFKYLDQQYINLVAFYHLLVRRGGVRRLSIASTELVVYPGSEWYAQHFLIPVS
jgi:hypothetical protein